jgi:hypothetical protein
MTFCFGLKPHRPGAVKLRLATYLDFRQLPAVPAVFGHYAVYPASGWGMLGNDQWGDCAEAGACHQEMLWSTEGGHPAPFDTTSCLVNYSAITNFNINDGTSGSNPSDQGTDVGQLADYWRNTGLVDSNGVHHKIVAVMDLNPGDLRELWTASYLFQCVGLGFNIPQSALNQTTAGQAWDVVADDGGIQGGHYVPAMGRIANGNGILITWGKTQQFTPAFYQKYSDQGIVALSEDMMIAAKSIDGFDDALLRSDIRAL